MLKMLIVDDDKIEREGIRFLAAQKGFNFIYDEAKNGKEALQKIIDGKSYDIIITDIKMPVMDGLAFIREALKLGITSRVIIYSGYSDFEFARSALKLKVHNYLLKPIDEEEFETVLKGVIKNYEEEKREIDESEKSLRAHYLFFELHNSIGTDLDTNKVKIDDGIIFLCSFDKKIVEMNYAQIERVISDNCGLYEFDIIFLNEQEVSFFIYGIDFDRERTKRIAENCIESFKQITYCEAVIVISEKFNGIKELKNNYNKVQEIMEHRFFIQDSRVLYYDTDTKILDTEILGKNANSSSVYEYLLDIIKDMEIKEKYSDIYVKYEFIKALEKKETNISKKFIEEIMGCGSYLQLKNLIEKYIQRDNHEQLSINEKVVDDIKTYIDNNYNLDISLDKLAELAYLSPNYLSVIFKEKVKKSPIQYLAKIRMEEAIKLVENTNMKVRDIVKEVGYNNSSYFIMLFKNNYGMTPKQYREKKINE